MQFTWDPRKAAANAAKHRVVFTEAATVFADPLAITYPDPDHSREEERLITIGTSLIRNATIRFASSVPAASRPKKDDYMSQEVNRTLLDDDLRAEYDETVLQNGVRGKYAQRYAAGTNLVRLAPDVAAAFPTEEAVNEALRLLPAIR